MHLHIDAGCGAAGDMLLAALLDLGLDADDVCAELARLPLEPFGVDVTRVNRSGLQALHVTVSEKGHAAMEEHSHAGPHRHLKDMLAVLEKADLPSGVRAHAERVLRLLAEAEGHVHGKSPDEIHFHEVSGIDTLVDVIGVCLCLEKLGVERVTCWPVGVGSGTVHCAHGEMPVPAPATLEILRRGSVPFSQTAMEGEILTPTGAALLATLVDAFSPAPLLHCTAVGYGAGTREVSGFPNCVRLLLGETGTAGGDTDTVWECTAVVDDMTPEELSFCFEQCFVAGALDAYAVPAQMKKGRLGWELTVLAQEDRKDIIEKMLFRHSSTFGLRVRQTQRSILSRKKKVVSVRGHQISVKQGLLDGCIVRIHPEYDDCRAAALSLGCPIGQIMAEARQNAIK